MSDLRRLPDSEFEVMNIIWNNSSPITTLQIYDQLPVNKKVTQQTLLTRLSRLINKGFLASERIGKERNYTPTISKTNYMKLETEAFISRHFIFSIESLIDTFYYNKNLSQAELDELNIWLSKRRGTG